MKRRCDSESWWKTHVGGDEGERRSVWDDGGGVRVLPVVSPLQDQDRIGGFPACTLWGRVSAGLCGPPLKGKNREGRNVGTSYSSESEPHADLWIDIGREKCKLAFGWRADRTCQAIFGWKWADFSSTTASPRCDDRRARHLIASRVHGRGIASLATDPFTPPRQRHLTPCGIRQKLVFGDVAQTTSFHGPLGTRQSVSESIFSINAPICEAAKRPSLHTLQIPTHQTPAQSQPVYAVIANEASCALNARSCRCDGILDFSCYYLSTSVRYCGPIAQWGRRCGSCTQRCRKKKIQLSSRSEPHSIAAQTHNPVGLGRLIVAGPAF